MLRVLVNRSLSSVIFDSFWCILPPSSEVSRGVAMTCLVSCVKQGLQSAAWLLPTVSKVWCVPSSQIPVWWARFWILMASQMQQSCLLLSMSMTFALPRSIRWSLLLWWSEIRASDVLGPLVACWLGCMVCQLFLILYFLWIKSSFCFLYASFVAWQTLHFWPCCILSLG